MKAGFIYKRALVLMLCIVMLISCWVFTASPQASATSGGTYYVKVTYQVDNAHDSGSNYIKVNYRDQNGSTSSYNIGGSCASSTGGKEDKRGVSGVPYSIEYHNYGSSTDHCDWWITGVYVYSGSDYSTGGTTLWTGKFGCTNAHYNGSTISCTYSIESNSYGSWSGDGTSTKSTNSNGWKGNPAANSTSISGGSNVAVPTDGSSTNYSSAFTAGAVYDQYGVTWYQSASLSSDKAGGTGFSNSKVSVTSGCNRADNYTVTVKASCGNASASKGITITTFDYIVIFKDWDGTQLKKQENINYNASATAPSSPSREPDATNHYAFKSWDGTYTSLTSGAQTKTVTATYTGTAHSGWTYSEISGDHTNHTKKCGSCTYSTPVVHTYGAPTITFDDDGKTATAKRVCTTSGCGHTETKSLSMASGGGITSAVQTPATCLVKGTTRYTATVTFTKVGSETNTATKTKDVQDIAALGHNWKTPTFVWSADCSSCTATRECTRDASHKETQTVTQIDKEEVAPSTCTVNGSTKYTAHSPWDDGTTNEKTLDDLPALGHDWNPTVITFAADGKTATASRTCKRDAKHVETVAAPVSHVEKTPATCTEKGWTTYTATSPFDGDTATDSVDKQDIAALGHDWNPVTFEFAADGKTATATRVCRTDGKHVESAAAIMSHAVKTPATCEGDGTTTYTATSPWGDGATESVDRVDIAAIGHSWGDWEDLGENGHRRVCANDASHIESSATHTYTSYTKDLPEDETVLAKLEAVGFNGETQCYHYCTACNNVEIQNHNYTRETTKEPNCTEGGIDTYTCEYCHTSYTKEINPLGHDDALKLIKAEPKDGIDISDTYVCFLCTRCNHYFVATYKDNTYVAQTTDKGKPIEGAESKSGVSSSDKVPSPYFNSYATDPSEEGFDYDYSYRDSSLKLMKDAYVDTENTRQDFRFSGAVTIPEGISYEVNNPNVKDNVITDFGFIYTQDSYGGKYGAAKLTLENVAKDNHYAKMSVVDNNAGSAFDGSNWSGVTYHPKTEVRDVETLTFNLVISMKAKNWKKQYAARPYITYKYHGVEYTVYDTGTSNNAYPYSFGSVYAIAAASISMNKDITSDVVFNYVTNRIINHRNDFGTDAATDWWRWFNQYKTYEENVNDPKSFYNWYLSELEAL